MDSEAVRERESCMGIPGWERQQGLALTKELERTEYNIPCLMSLSNVSNVFHLQKYIDIVALIMEQTKVYVFSWCPHCPAWPGSVDSYIGSDLTMPPAT